VTLNILTNVKYYDELLRKVNVDHYVCKIELLKTYKKLKKNLKRYERRENAVCALCARRERERAVNTLQQLLAHHRNAMHGRYI